MNVEFRYLYRDGGNYKKYSAVVFSNKKNLDPELISASLSATLVDGVFFEAHLIHVPPLFFREFLFDPSLDHEFHEFEGLTLTSDSITDVHCRDIDEVVLLLCNSCGRRGFSF